MAGHTPGPWKVIEQPPAGRSAWLVGRPRDVAREDVLVCEMPFNATREEQATEYQANARLIAAAPDMLAALRECQKVLEMMVNRDGAQPSRAGTMAAWASCVQAETRARKAIAKAEGRE